MGRLKFRAPRHSNRPPFTRSHSSEIGKQPLWPRILVLDACWSRTIFRKAAPSSASRNLARHSPAPLLFFIHHVRSLQAFISPLRLHHWRELQNPPPSVLTSASRRTVKSVSAPVSAPAARSDRVSASGTTLSSTPT